MCPISIIDFALATDTVLTVEFFAGRLEGMDECIEIPVDLVALTSGLFRPKVSHPSDPVVIGVLVVLSSVLGRRNVLSISSGVLSSRSHVSLMCY